MKKFQQRRGTPANLAAANELPLDGEIYVEATATSARLKVGDGTTRYNSLPYVTGAVALADVSGLQAALDGKQPVGSYAALVHSHVAASITDFAAAVIAAAPPTTDASLLTSGVLAIARIPTGSTSSTVCVGDDARLTNSRAPTGAAGGDLTGTFPSPTLATTGVAAGTYTSVTVDTKGRVTGGTNPAGYSLPVASSSVLGGVRIGSGLAVDGSGVISVSGGYTLPNATTSTLGGVIVGSGLGVTSGTISVTYGTAANTACQGNDARLSDSRVPLSHTHGNITNAGAIGSTAGLPIVTTTSGVLTVGTFGSAAGSFCAGDDSRLTNSRAPSGNAGGDLTGTYPNPTLATSGVTAGTYTSVTVDTKGRVTAGSNPAGYSLPIASASTLGGVRIGSGVSIDASGVISVSGGYTLPDATTSTKGGVIVGTGLGVTAGTISVTYGSTANTACQGNDARLSDSRVPLAHNQAWSTITATPTTLTGYGITDAVASSDSRLTDARTPLAHQHSGADITSGTVATARLGSGVANSTTFLRGDGQWAAPAGGGSSSASDLTSGTLSQSRLDFVPLHPFLFLGG